MAPYLSADQILATDDRKYAEVEVPEWGGTVRLATMTAQQRDQYEYALANRKEDDTQAPSMRATLVAACAVDENGALLFTAQQVEALSAKNASALNRLWHKCLEINLMRKQDAAAVQGS